MSIIDSYLINVPDASKMRFLGVSLASSLYKEPLTILLSGELGMGKTTLVQGLAEGLGVRDIVRSPTFALEQHYDQLLTHIDLYRLAETQAEEFLTHSEDFQGIRAIEWSERASTLHGDIEITIEEVGTGREVRIEFKDMTIPEDSFIKEWISEVALPPHIVKHMNAVASVTERISDSLIESGRIVRKHAVRAAAKAHDIMRFVDFKTWDGDEYYKPSRAEVETWKRMKEKYGAPHEQAAQRFLRDKGFPEIGTIVRPHRGYDPPVTSEKIELKTTEQLVLAYSDKRVRFDEIVSLDERFNDFIKRYGKGSESAHAKEWRTRMKEIERKLFPQGVPF